MKDGGDGLGLSPGQCRISLAAFPERFCLKGVKLVQHPADLRDLLEASLVSWFPGKVCESQPKSRVVEWGAWPGLEALYTLVVHTRGEFRLKDSFFFFFNGGKMHNPRHREKKSGRLSSQILSIVNAV